ncbi:Uncharacterised protein [Enterobacter hormaechei]|nr:Uncharacterised protein [Enterobacter hormaechei]VAM02764.1 Uncharacterised protein [Enterobacter hormaechei]
MAKQLHAIRHYCGRFRAIVDNHHQRTDGKMFGVLLNGAL